jgi:hypothetical protein
VNSTKAEVKKSSENVPAEAKKSNLGSKSSVFEGSPSLSRDATFDPGKEQNLGRRRHRNAAQTQAQREAAMYHLYIQKKNEYFESVRTGLFKIGRGILCTCILCTFINYGKLGL